ncbi:hypothetical protein [Aquisphaera giovannonii]|uniref:hypothetical protein n=1 Tax=Aquisphaera giovannonii TaxID=406548 RepID=UPI0011DFD2F1|nr:hypothetical protein [Aquisphaera giovannonii]
MSGAPGGGEPDLLSRRGNSRASTGRSSPGSRREAPASSEGSIPRGVAGSPSFASGRAFRTRRRSSRTWKNSRLIADASRRSRSTAALAARASRPARSASVSPWSISSRPTRSSASPTRKARASSADSNGPASSRQASEARIIGWHAPARSLARAKNASQSTRPFSSRAWSARKTSLTCGKVSTSIGSYPSILTSRYRPVGWNRLVRPTQSRTHRQSRISHARPAPEPSSSRRIAPAPPPRSSPVASPHSSSRRTSSSARSPAPASAASCRSSAARTARSR